MDDLAALVGRLEAVLGAAEGEPVALDGGITNRNYRLRFGGVDCVVRVPGKDTELLGIDRDAERLASEAAAEIGIAPEVVAVLGDCLVTRFVGGRVLTREELRADPAPVARALRAFHDCGVRLPVRFAPARLAEGYAAIVEARGGEVSDDHRYAIELMSRIDAALPPAEPVPCHDDLNIGNLIRDGDRTFIVDWEYAGMGDRFFDLGSLSVGNQFDEAADDALLRAYFDAPPTRGHAARLALMRVMSDAWEACWGAVQQSISELDADFPTYAAERFERVRAAAADPRFEEALSAAAA